MSKPIDLQGKRFGRYFVKHRVPGRQFGSVLWLCACDCGKEKIQTCASLIHAGVVSCGCYATERRIEAKTTHGHTKGDTPTAEYRCYIGMKRRCSNPHDKCSHIYFNKGIRVCERWLGPNGFINFLQDMGPRPSPRHSIDRREGGLGYSKENCRWATPVEQARNISSNRRFEINGMTKCLSEWAEFFYIDYKTLHRRVKMHERHGLSVESAILQMKDGIKFRAPFIKQACYIESRGKKLSQSDWAKELGISHNQMYGRIAKCRKKGLSLEAAIY